MRWVNVRFAHCCSAAVSKLLRNSPKNGPRHADGQGTCLRAFHKANDAQQRILNCVSLAFFRSRRTHSRS